MGYQYMVGNQGITPSVTDQLFNITYKSAANIIARVTEIGIGGEATASTVNRMAVRRSSTDGVTPTTAQTPAKASSSGPAAQGTSAVGFTTEPVAAAAPALWAYALNVFGGIVRWVAAPGQELLVQGATAGNDELGLGTLSGVGVVTDQLVVEEI